MTEKAKKTEFVEKVRLSRAKWDRAIEGIDREDMLRSGFCGEWSLKDVLSHITWYEREMVNLLKAREFTGADYWDLPTDERNQRIYEERKEIDIELVVEEYAAVYDELIQQLELLTDDHLNDPANFPGMPSDWQPWQVIASNTYKHYEGHIPHAETFKRIQ
jgi:hypothetical protein